MTINTLNNHTSTTESIVMPVVRPGVKHEGARGLGRVQHSIHNMKRKLQRARNVVVDEMRRGEECFTLACFHGKHHAGVCLCCVSTADIHEHTAVEVLHRISSRAVGRPTVRNTRWMIGGLIPLETRTFVLSVLVLEGIRGQQNVYVPPCRRRFLLSCRGYSLTAWDCQLNNAGVHP